eukprot:CFRG2384T1
MWRKSSSNSSAHIVESPSPIALTNPSEAKSMAEYKVVTVDKEIFLNTYVNLSPRKGKTKFTKSLAASKYAAASQPVLGLSSTFELLELNVHGSDKSSRYTPPLSECSNKKQKIRIYGSSSKKKDKYVSMDSGRDSKVKPCRILQHRNLLKKMHSSCGYLVDDYNESRFSESSEKEGNKIAVHTTCSVNSVSAPQRAAMSVNHILVPIERASIAVQRNLSKDAFIHSRRTHLNSPKNGISAPKLMAVDEGSGEEHSTVSDTLAQSMVQPSNYFQKAFRREEHPEQSLESATNARHDLCNTSLHLLEMHLSCRLQRANTSNFDENDMLNLRMRFHCALCPMVTHHCEDYRNDIRTTNEFDSIYAEERRHVLDEIIATESRFVAQLSVIKKYETVVRDSRVVDEEAISKIFPPCLNVLIDSHTVLLETLKTFCCLGAHRDEHMIGDIFMSEIAAICTLQTQEKSNQELATLLIKEDGEKNQCLGLSSFLLTPIQRLPRYVLLLQALLSVTPEHHPDHSELHMSVVYIERLLKYINACKHIRESESMLGSFYRKIKKIDSKIECSDEGRVWLLDSPAFVTIDGEKRVGYLFLFNDILLLTKNKKKSVDTFSDTVKETVDYSNLTYLCSVPRYHAIISGRTMDSLNIVLKGGDVHPKGMLVTIWSPEPTYLMVWTMGLSENMP